MAFQVHQALKKLCCNTAWKYAIFWKLSQCARMVLTWEDAYYGDDEKLFTNMHNSHDEALGLAVAKMSCHVYSLGEGTVGHVAVTGKHLWISADKWAATRSSIFEYAEGWENQFSAGIKTIAVVGLGSLGVVQLGSLNDIPEDLKMVEDIRDVFFSETHLQGENLENASLGQGQNCHYSSQEAMPMDPTFEYKKDPFSLPNLPNAFCPYEMTTNQTPLSHTFAGWELYEALGPAFQKGKNVNLWESEKTEVGPTVTSDSSLLMSESTTDHLLEAVVGNIRCQQESDDVGMVSSGAFLEKQQEPVRRTGKKRAKPGETGRPRPRDRQLIQERIKELRDLVPNGSKCSIDSLLERAIQHMLYMQSITKHDEVLNECTASKETMKGSSWAVELGTDLRLCPIIVENLNTNGHLLVEMLLEDCSHFLEIAEAIRSLELTILKGVAESYGEKTRMLFVVEGLENRVVHRMDVLLSLMQLVSPVINV